MDIPITFDHKGKTYSGILSPVQGAGQSTIYHLYINKYYKGRLRISAHNNQWVFDGDLEELAEAFGQWITFAEWAHTESRHNREEFICNMIEGADEN